MIKKELIEVVESRDLVVIDKKLKSLQSIKCRIKNNVMKKEQYAEVCSDIDYLVSAKAELSSKKLTSTSLTQSDIDSIEDLDTLLRYKKSIQSKKSNTRWLTDTEGSSEEFKSACHIEQLLNSRIEQLGGQKSNTVRINRDLLVELIEKYSIVELEQYL